MSSDKDLDLPARVVTGVPVRIEKTSSPTALTEKQVDRVIDISGEAVAHFADIAKSLVDIHRIKTQANADVARVEANTRAVVERIRAEIEKMAEEREALRTRGQISVDVIAGVTRALERIPDVDTGSRKALIDTIPRVVELAFKPK